jgi:hypothetical protein
MNATAAAAAGDQRAWWLRTLLVLQAPRAVFAAVRDESPEAVEARQEPVTALIFLAGVAGVLLAPRFGRLYDDPEVDALLVVVIAIAAGGIYAFFSYWVLGWALSLGVRAAGGEAPARRCRHVLAFAVAPLALSLLVVWPLRLAVYGGDVFRSGGADSGTGGQIFDWLALAFVVWSFALLVVGMRTVQRWTWARAAGASAFAIGLVALVIAGWRVLGGLGGGE